MNTEQQYQDYVLHTYGRFPLIPEKGEGSYLWDTHGKKYLDFCTGIAVCSVGHCHPNVTQTIQQQAAKLVHCSNLYQIPQQAELAQYITEEFVKLPGKVFFSNSGAEANEGLIKFARKFGHHAPNKNGDARTEIITFKQSFHGRTLAALAATAKPAIQQGFSPITPGFKHAEFNNIESVKQLITANTCAILLEPLQGEGGVNPATQTFLTQLQALCNEHDLLLMFDEVQCGFGRLGTEMGWRAIAKDIQPDAIAWAKGMGGGFPIGGFWISNRKCNGDTNLSSLLDKGSHGSTYGGSPLASAASLAVLQEIKTQNLAQNAHAMGALLKQKITALESNKIDSIRGAGLMLGIAIKKSNHDDDSSPALEACIELMELGLLTVPAGTHTLRLLPPLNISASEVDEAVALIKQANSLC